MDKNLELAEQAASSPLQTPPPAELTPSAARKEKGRVRFNSTAADDPPRHQSPERKGDDVSMTRLRPSVLRGNSYNSVTDFPEPDEKDESHAEKTREALAAQARAQHVAATLLGSYSAPGSRRTSVDSDANTVSSRAELLPHRGNIPLDEFDSQMPTDQTDGSGADMRKTTSQEAHKFNTEAYNIVRAHTISQHHGAHGQEASQVLAPGLDSGQITPSDDRHAEFYAPPPTQYRPSVLSNILRLYKPPEIGESSNHQHHHHGSDVSVNSGFTTPGSSGTATPTRKKWYKANRSQDTLANLVEASARLGGLATSGPIGPGESRSTGGSPTRPKYKPRPKYKRSASSRVMNLGRHRMEDEVRITIHIAEVLSRQRYITNLCKALMLFGAPTHRLEEYLRMTARVLEIDGQFLYLPGCMMISFDDRPTHTTEVRIVRNNQGIDLGKLKDTHEIYKEVLHDVISVEEAYERLSKVLEDKDLYPVWVRVLMFGLASATVAPFAFEGQWNDLPACFFLGCIVGMLQLRIAPRSDLYNNVFEVTAAMLTSFLARALGSINGGSIFCFSAMAQSSIALILPGWLVLSSALELQSKAIVPGSIRMVHAIIYSLFLGFGILVGTTVYGLLDKDAVSSVSCRAPISDTTGLAFVFVPLFTLCLAFVNQARFKQLPVMVFIAFTGYIVNFYSNKVLEDAPQIANMLGALVIGVLANLYSRLRHGLAVAALLPAIFVQVPSGLAATGSLLSGLQTANQISGGHGVEDGASPVPSSNDNMDNMVYSVAMSMVQIAVGITVGLFMSSLLVYPFGKRRSGLFSL